MRGYIGFVIAFVWSLLFVGCSNGYAPCHETAGGCSVVINELYPGGVDDSHPDWVEMKNRGAVAIELMGYRFTDTNYQFEFPPGVSIPPGGYLVLELWREANPGPVQPLRAQFQLNRTEGEEVYLVAPDGVVDAVQLPPGLSRDVSWGRIPDGTGPFEANSPTPGAQNR